MTRSRLSIVVPAILLLLAATLLAPPSLAADTAPKKVTTVEGITEYQLDNGLRFLLFPDASRPTVTVALTIFVGSRHEGYGETGMAHLLEHMLFKGTPTHPRVDQVLRERGARYNGTTWYDRTNYYETLPASDENLEFAIRFEADRMVNSFVRREDLLSEMTVVRNEFEQGENDPGSILSQRIWATAFEWHNYGKETIGNRSDIERVPIDRLQEFYRKHYQPDNAMLVVAGKFDADKALTFTQKYFGAIPRPKRRLAETYTEEPPQDGERIVTLRRVGEIGNVGVAYHIPSGRHEDFAAIDVMTTALTNRPSGRLYKLLVETKKAANVSGAAYALHDPGLVTFTATLPKDGSIEQVRDLLVSSLETIAEGLPAEDIERAKRQMLTDIEREITNTTQFAVSLSDWAAVGDWRLFFLHRDRVEKVTADQVKAVAGKYLIRNNRTVGVYIPTAKPERATVPSAPPAKELVASYTGRASAAEGEVFDPAWANIEARTRRVALPSGAKIAMLPKKTRGQEVHLQLVLKFGDEESLKEVREATGYLPSLMMRGTKRFNYQQFRDELEKHQVELAPSFGREGIGSLGFTMRAKRPNLPAGLDLLRQMLREPTLPEDQFELLKTQRVAGLERSRNEPHVLSIFELQRRLRPYDKDDVRATLTIDERIQRARSVKIDEVRRLYNEFLGAGNFEVSIVGDFDADSTLKSIEQMLSDWKAQRSYVRVGVGKPSEPVIGKHTISTPDKANANYVAGLVLAMRDDDPDYPALRLAAYALGSGPGSRLWDRVREKEGLSYGVGCGLSTSSHERSGTLRFQAICNPENIVKVENAIREEIDRFLKEGIGDEELAKAKRGYLQASQLQRASDTGLTGILLDQLDTGRTSSFSAELEKKIEALTAEQVSEAFRKHIDPAKLVIVTAGDFEQPSRKKK